MMKTEKTLILGGTREAVELAEKLVNSGHDVITSLAGRTREPEPIVGKTRVGGFGGADGLSQWLKKNDIDRVIDATHPFALQISRNAATAARDAGIELEIYSRPPWVKTAGDKWIEVSSLAAAAQAIPAHARVFLALGSQHISNFTRRKNCHFVVRMVDPPTTKLSFDDYTLITGKPASVPASEASLMVDHDITHVVCRNSGGQGAYAKIAAARKLNLPVIMIQRPDNAQTS